VARPPPAGPLPPAPLILFDELAALDLVVEQETGVANLLDAHTAQHLADDHLDVLVVNLDPLQAVDLLHLVDQVLGQFLFTEHAQNVVRIAGAVHERLAGTDEVPFVDTDVLPLGIRYSFGSPTSG